MRTLSLLWMAALQAPVLAAPASDAPATSTLTQTPAVWPAPALARAPAAQPSEAPTASPQPPPPSAALTLERALHTADQYLPELRQAASETEAARARADQARAPLLPQAELFGTYDRYLASDNDSATGGSGARGYNQFNFGASASQLLFDGGQTSSQWRAARHTVRTQELSRDAVRLDAIHEVRVRYFGARARQELLEVARQTLANQERHLLQVEGFVEVGTRPPIDLAQARLARANARLQLIEAENAFSVARAQLNRAMGLEGSLEYQLADDQLTELQGEDTTLEAHLEEALRMRPEYAALESQLRAQQERVRSARAGYLPRLSFETGFSEGGTELEQLGWTLYGGLSLRWSLFDGLQTPAQTREERANLAALEARRDALRQEVRLELEQARLAVRAAKASVEVAEEALTNARERLRLAEGRYETGVGSIIELEDAQLALTETAAQRVQATYNLATARAGLLRTLSRR